MNNEKFKSDKSQINNKKVSASKDGAQKLKFEESINILEKIVERLENAECSLEDMVELYKDGISIANNCREELERVEGEILLLQKEGESFTKRDFTPVLREEEEL